MMRDMLRCGTRCGGYSVKRASLNQRRQFVEPGWFPGMAAWDRFGTKLCDNWMQRMVLVVRATPKK